jgi:hypothetical protein
MEIQIESSSVCTPVAVNRMQLMNPEKWKTSMRLAPNENHLLDSYQLVVSNDGLAPGQVHCCFHWAQLVLDAETVEKGCNGLLLCPYIDI